MPSYIFPNLDEFNAWHEAIMKELGIPDGLGTLVYTEPIIHPENGTVVANVDERANISQYQKISKNDIFDLGYKERPAISNPLIP